MHRPITVQYRDCNGRVVRKGTPGAKPVRLRARKWYAWITTHGGRLRRIPLSENEAAAKDKLDKLRARYGWNDSRNSRTYALERAADSLASALCKKPEWFTQAQEHGFFDDDAANADKIAEHVWRIYCLATDRPFISLTYIKAGRPADDHRMIELDARTCHMRPLRLAVNVRALAKEHYPNQSLKTHRAGPTVQLTVPDEKRQAVKLMHKLIECIPTVATLEAVGNMSHS